MNDDKQVLLDENELKQLKERNIKLKEEKKRLKFKLYQMENFMINVKRREKQEQLKNQ